MKSACLFGFIMVSLLLFSCGQKVEEKVIGRWKIEDITAPEPDLSKVADSLKPYYKEQLRLQQTQMLETGYYEFNKDGQSIFEVNGKRFDGKWRLGEDEKQIFLKGKGELKEEAMDIREISGTVFILELNDQGQITRIVLKKSVE